MSQPGNALPWVRLWRVEHCQTGHGPFHSIRGPGAPRVAWTFPHRPYEIPSPHWDTSWVHKVDAQGSNTWQPFGEASRFAFANGLAVRRWIDHYAAYDAARLGYVMRVVAVPQEAHLRSRHQAIYDCRAARVLHTYSLLRLPVALYGAAES